MKTQAIVTNIPLNINIKIANTSDRFSLLSNLAWKLNTLDLTKSTVSYRSLPQTSQPVKPK